jgi:hypothetical protein
MGRRCSSVLLNATKSNSDFWPFWNCDFVCSLSKWRFKWPGRLQRLSKCRWAWKSTCTPAQRASNPRGVTCPVREAIFAFELRQAPEGPICERKDSRTFRISSRRRVSCLATAIDPSAQTEIGSGRSMPPKSGFLARENRSPVDQKCSITTLIRDAAKVLSSKLIGTRLLSRLTLVHASRGAPRGTFRSSDSSPTGRRAAIRVACRV